MIECSNPNFLENAFSNLLTSPPEGNHFPVRRVLIAASTSSTDPVHIAAQACRQRGRIVLLGVTGLELRRDLFYKKELSFQVSCSYGPGRYDPLYEQKGLDYPIGFVRWTEKRNFEAILEALRIKSLKTESLISHKYPIEKATEIYELLRSEKYKLGLLIYYKNNELKKQSKTIEIENNRKLKLSNEIKLGFIGTGNFAISKLIPCFAEMNISLYKTVFLSQSFT